MRIISGTAKGRSLSSPKTDKIRPVADKVKGAIFNILGSVEDLNVLDCFAGVGSVGLEAASRGAHSVLLVDCLPEALKLLQKNIEACRVEGIARVIRGELPGILSKIRHDKAFDLIFVDPPYDKNLVNPTLEALLKYKFVDAQSRIIIEHSPREQPACPGLSLVDSRKYGQTLISFFELSEASS